MSINTKEGYDSVIEKLRVLRDQQKEEEALLQKLRSQVAKREREIMVMNVQCRKFEMAQAAGKASAK